MVTRDRAQVELTQDGLERPTPPAVLTGQSAPVASKRPVASQEKPYPTQVGETTGQSAPVVGKRSAASQEIPDQTHNGETTGQRAPIAENPLGGVHPQPAMNRLTQTSRNGQLTQLEPLDRPFGPSYFIPGKVKGKPVLCLLDTGFTTNLIGKHVFDCLPDGMMADGTRLLF